VVGWIVDNRYEGVAMKTCSDNHDEIAFDDQTKTCPVCAVAETLGEEIADLKDEVRRLESRLE
jgi:hypothetical protein